MSEEKVALEKCVQALKNEAEYSQEDFPELVMKLAEKVAFTVEKDTEFVLSNYNKNFFSDLGMDSLIALEIVANLENTYGIEIPESKVVEIATFEGIVKLIYESEHEPV